MTILFYDQEGNPYDSEYLLGILKDIGADDCETLFIHSDVMFGKVPTDFNRKEYLRLIHTAVEGLNISNIIVPTFTYSFPNHEIYDVRKSKSLMGAYSEYVRKLDGRYRTIDPLLSVSVPDNLQERFQKVSNHSLGVGSALDILHNMDNVKFLFLGAEMADCFTYVHYVEKIMNVPYRFDMPFEGDVIYSDENKEHRTQTINTQCWGVKLPAKYGYFENEMEEKCFLKKKRVADKYVACISEKDAYREIKQHIEKDINYFLAIPFKETDLIHRYTYDTQNGRITHC